MRLKIETDEVREAKMLVKAGDMASLLWEIKHNFWRKWKHKSDEEFTLEDYREELCDIYHEHGIDIDDLFE